MQHAVRAEGISFAYPQQGYGLSPISIQVQEGECLLVSGGSGSGKSTLARCLSGLIPHLYRGNFAGQVRILDLPTSSTPMWKISEKAGMVFQNPASQMLANTVEDEILFGLENLGLSQTEAFFRLEEALRRFNLSDLRTRSPHTLSGGEQQKLALASVLARHPALLVLDEPLSMLDTTSALEFANFLNETGKNGNATVICEHRLEFLRQIQGLREMPLPGNSQAFPLPETPPLPASLNPIREINLRKVSIERGGNTILHNIDLNLPAGKVIALVGRNGSGKTTLMRALAGLQKCEGQIFFDQQRVPPQLGMVFQNPDLQLFNATVRSEILHRVPNPSMRVYEWLLNVLDLRRYEETPPLLLSEGEKRRVALASLLIRVPQHGILLDEPALGQDSHHKELLLRLLRTLARQGYLVLFSTHDLELALQADELVLIGSQGIAAQGDPAKLKNSAAWDEIGLILPPWLRQSC